MDNNIVLSPISLDELETRLINRFKAEFVQQIPTSATLPEDDFISVKQAAKLLQVSLVTIHKWKREGKLKYYRYGTRIRFKRSEILNTDKTAKAGK